MTNERLLNKITTQTPLEPDEIVALLRFEGDRLTELYAHADTLRARYMGDDIYIRGIIEFSNYCRKNCNYCGIQKHNAGIERYRMSFEEILSTCKAIEKSGQTTVVLQSGEDAFYTPDKIAALIERIKKETTLAITLSVGERDRETYEYWHEKGMDRYLLRFETSNPRLFHASHPDDDLDSRLECLRVLKEIGVQTGSGFLIGLPGESLDDLAEDILFCTQLGLDMIGVGPFIPHNATLFASEKNPFEAEIYFKVIAILRLLNKDAHIPSTTAFDAIDPNGRNLLLERGANVFMPNATPQKYRTLYQLYPGKPCVDESGDECCACVRKRIAALGRTIGKGPGHSIRKK
jgi:biotin synthase